MPYQSNCWYHGGSDNWCSVKLTEEKLDFRINIKCQSRLNFHDACDQAAIALQQQWSDRPLYLSLSGGLDSELVANVLKRNRVAFTPFILNIAKVNAPETWYARRWCYINSMCAIEYNMTLQQFLIDVLSLRQHVYNTHQLAATVNIWIAKHIESLGGYCVSGVGDVNFDFANQCFFNNTIDWVHNLFLDNQHPTGFLSYTPELMASYIEQFDTTQDEQYNKLRFYDVSDRPKVDYLGQLFDSSNAVKYILQKHRQTTANSSRNNFGSKHQLLTMLYE